ncbi:hypothetical protein EDD21DRAFT_349027 [Dissophora ornata]|nr:hypothetical protein EDD21DRAFT_349027 [Dissophora ornata]
MYSPDTSSYGTLDTVSIQIGPQSHNNNHHQYHPYLSNFESNPTVHRQEQHHPSLYAQNIGPSPEHSDHETASSVVSSPTDLAASRSSISIYHTSPIQLGLYSTSAVTSNSSPTFSVNTSQVAQHNRTCSRSYTPTPPPSQKQPQCQQPQQQLEQHHQRRRQQRPVQRESLALLVWTSAASIITYDPPITNNNKHTEKTIFKSASFFSFSSSPSSSSFSSPSSAQLLKTSPLSSPSDAAAAMGSDDGSSNMFMNPCADGDFIVRALHEYHTDSPGHLSFSQFQYIKVRHCEESGWWLGESENKRGWFPSNRVEKVDPVYETEITSEDYDQIRTGLDGVETQFLGEPVTDSVSDSMQLDWGARSPPMGGIGAGTGVWTRAGQLAFPPSQLSIIPQSSYYASESTANMGSDSYYQQTQMSSTTTVTGEETGAGTNGIDNEDLSYAYSDFVTEVGLYVRELREAASRGEIDRYQPIVASIFACVKALLIFTNTIARESEVLQMYPELARSRQFILRALGKLYSKCRVANGSQARTTSRQRQFAVEKLGIFGGQVLGGITEFTTRAHEIGLRLRAESAAEAATGGGVGAGAKELDMVLTTSGSITSSSPVTSSPSYQRLRRRVSRANSAKGYKSFNAVRQWRAENIQKYNTARKSVELLLAEYMECLNNGNGATELDRVLRTTIQAAQAVELFLVSAEEMRARTNAKEDNEYAAHKAELSSTLMELFDYIRVLEIASGTMSSSNETVMNRFLSLASVVLRCLAEMDVHPKANLASSLESSESSTRSSFSEEHEPEVPKLPSATPAMVPIPAAPINNSMCGEESLPSGQANSNNDTQPKYASPRNTASPRQKHLINVVTPVMPLKKKFGSLTSLNERYKRQAVGQQSSDKDGSHLNPEAAYGEGNDMDRNHPDLYRSSHDTAVVITSARNTSHRGLKNADEGTPSLGPAVVEAESQLKETTGEHPRPTDR